MQNTHLLCKKNEYLCLQTACEHGARLIIRGLESNMNKRLCRIVDWMNSRPRKECFNKRCQVAEEQISANLSQQMTYHDDASNRLQQEQLAATERCSTTAQQLKSIFVMALVHLWNCDAIGPLPNKQLMTACRQQLRNDTVTTIMILVEVRCVYLISMYFYSISINLTCD